MSGIKPFSNASHRGYAAIRAEQERQAREAQEREAQQAAEKAQRDQDTAKLVNSIHARTIYYDKLSNAQKKALNSWASSLPRPEGASDFKTFYEGPYGYYEALPKSPNTSMKNNGNPNASKQKKPGKSAKRKSSTRKTKRSQKQC